jgi:hypothetical protein
MKAALAVALVLPVVGLRAEPIVVDYDGTITEVVDAPDGYAVGDHISGRLLIDPSVGFTDIDPTPNQAQYRSSSPAFVSGFFPSFGTPADEVDVGDEVVGIAGIDGPIDSFGVQDWRVPDSGSFDAGSVITVGARLRGLLDSTRLEQSFEVTAADANESVEDLSGGINFRTLGPSFVRFVLNRLTVKPGHCSAPS